MSTCNTKRGLRTLALIAIILIIAVLAMHLIPGGAGATRALTKELRAQSEAIERLDAKLDDRCDVIEAKLDRIESKMDRVIELLTPALPDNMKAAAPAT